MKRPPRAYFSFRSPFSWLAIHRVRARIPGLFEQFEMVPYWDPDATTLAALHARDADVHYVQMSKAKHYYILQDTRRLSARMGLTMSWPIDDDPWWELPHLGFLLAARHGRAEEFYDAVIEARWQRGEDVCTEETIRRIATGLRLDPDEFAAAPHSPQLRAEGVDRLAEAYHDDVFGIPYFIVRRQRFWGLDRVDDLFAELDGTPTPSGPVQVAAPLDPATAPVDRDTPGGCG